MNRDEFAARYKAAQYRSMLAAYERQKEQEKPSKPSESVPQLDQVTEIMLRGTKPRPAADDGYDPEERRLRNFFGL